MPLAKIYVNEGQYDEARLTKISEAVQAALRGTLSVPPDDFFQLIFEMPRNRYLHTASFVGMEYTDDLVTLEILFVSGRSRETRLALLNDLDTRIAAAAGISPDDVFINLVEAPAKTSPSAKAKRSAPTRLSKSRPPSTIGEPPHPRLIETS
jgi:hypothetical protein